MASTKSGERGFEREFNCMALICVASGRADIGGPRRRPIADDRGDVTGHRNDGLRDAGPPSIFVCYSYG